MDLRSKRKLQQHGVHPKGLFIWNEHGYRKKRKERNWKWLESPLTEEINQTIIY